MKTIKLTQGLVTFVDDEDFNKFNPFKWQAVKKNNLYYARRTAWTGKGYVNIHLHREIMNCPSGMLIDHIDHNTLNNLRSNLRICTKAENMRNRPGPQRNSTSGYRGVYWHKAAGKWMAKIKMNGRNIYLGLFHDKENAKQAYIAANRKYFGKFGGNC